MIISKDLFIFGEQIFATIIPEIGTPNSGSSTTATATPPTTPISPVSSTHEHAELFHQQNQHPQPQQQNQPHHPINFNAIAEVALKVAAERVEAEVEADQQVCIKSTTTKTGTIKPISKAKSTATATITTTTITQSLSASDSASASIQATQENKQTEEGKSLLKPLAQIDSNAKKGKLVRHPKEINKVNKTKRANEQEHDLEQQEQQNGIILSGSLKRKVEEIHETFQLSENHRKQVAIECSSFEEEEQDIAEQERIEKEPLVKRDPIKIINAVTLPAITKRVQGEIDDESFCLLLSNELEVQQQLQQKHHQKHHQQQQRHSSNRQQTECRLQLEEPEPDAPEEQFLSPVPETSTAASQTSTTPTATIKTTSSTTTKTTPGNKAAMGKVVLGHNSSSGSNNASTRNDHAMVTFPLITDFHRTLQLTFQNITVQHNERKILSDVSGIVSPGEVLAIMGPSGCGKTTLLDCLSGQRRVDGGSIYLNREPISKKWRRKICYVLQEEVFFSGLTLRETVMYTALLRLPEKMPNAEKVKLVDRILQTLELNCCQQTKFGDYLNRGLSGGEKKRANIACELLTNPLLMLLDEPTSGLDSHSAISLMKVLKRYAIQEQKTVVITVHQPSSQMFHMFDKLLLLYNGRTAYFGEVNNIYSYFEDIGVAIKPHYNPADFVLEQLKSYPDIREKLFVAAKESHGNFINRNCITLNAKQHHQKLHQQAQNNHHNPQENGQITCGQTAFDTNNSSSDKSQKRDTLINDIINNYYKDITNNHLLNHNHLHYDQLNHHNNHKLHHINHDAPLLIMGGSSDDSHHDVCEDAAQQLWCATADSQSNFSSSSSDQQQYETDGDWLDYPTHFHTQFRVLLSRNFKEAKPLMLSKLNWLQTIGLALMAGAIWFQLPRTEEFLHDLQGWMFFSQTYWMLFALFGALNSFPAEREVISKERRSGAYRLSAYYLAKMFGELPLVITLPTVYLIISYPMLGCASFKLFFLMLVFLLLNTIVAQSVGFFIGACCMDMNVSITLSALYTLATQLFGGYLSSRIPEGLSWIRYTSMIHYAYQNMQILEFREGPAISCGSPSSFEICKNNSTAVIPYDEILKAQNSTSPLWLNTLVLMMFFLVFRVFGYAVLRYIRCPKT